MRFIKVSSKKYEARDQADTLQFTIKRSKNRYIVRPDGGCIDSYIVCDTLADAKNYIRNHHTHNTPNKKKGWIAFFIRHTKGLTFKSQQESNNHMKALAMLWSKHLEPPV